MIAGILNWVGFLITTTFLLGLYFEGRGPKKIEKSIAEINRIIAFALSLFLFQIALERYQHNFFKLPYISNFAHIFIGRVCAFVLHEAGHIYWSIFGDLFHSLGGTLNEILLPLILSLYCFAKLYLHLSGLSLYFVGYNLHHVAWYITDSINRKTADMSLHGIHDWKYLLGYFGAESHALELANIANTLGMVFIYSGVLIFTFAVFKKNSTLDQPTYP